jgi:drug/metabolite transporter (DMT)-like permease
MTAVTPDETAARRGGLGLAVASAVTFGTSGTLAKGLFDTGWSAQAAVTVRIWLAALLLLVPTLVALRGRFHLLARNAGFVVAYGLVPVAGSQWAYFQAVSYMQVGPALLVEYTAPVAVVVWLWLRRGERPGRRTVLGAAIALVGLAMVLDLFSGSASVSVIGVVWALVAMLCVVCYFVLSAHDHTGLPPLVLAGAGLCVGALALLGAWAVGMLDLTTSHDSVTYAGHDVAWWVPLVLLGLVSSAIPYVCGIEASRRLGSRLASFVALLEVLCAVLFAWALLGELPVLVQVVGGVLVLAGVVLVKLGERPDGEPQPHDPLDQSLGQPVPA